MFGLRRLKDEWALAECSTLLQAADLLLRADCVHLVVTSAKDRDGWLGMPHTFWMHDRGVYRAFETAAATLWSGNRGFQVDCKCQQCSVRTDVQDLFRGKPPSVVHWILRCNSPSSNIVWSSETDMMWPFLFRLNIRYLTKIRVPQGNGPSIALPLDIVKMIAVYL